MCRPGRPEHRPRRLVPVVLGNGASRPASRLPAVADSAGRRRRLIASFAAIRLSHYDARLIVVARRVLTASRRGSRSARMAPAAPAEHALVQVTRSIDRASGSIISILSFAVTAYATARLVPPRPARRRRDRGRRILALNPNLLPAVDADDRAAAFIHPPSSSDGDWVQADAVPAVLAGRSWRRC